MIDWSPDETSFVVTTTLSIPATIRRVHLDTGVRSKPGEVAPRDRNGLFGVIPNAWLDNGKAYAYTYRRILSTLYLVSRAQ